VHQQEASYYVSVIDGDRHILALGPFQEHNEALARVDAVNLEVNANWSDNGRAWFYGYGTARMPSTYNRPGKLNDVLGLTGPA
jgi:hypothetical protein